MDSWSSLLSAPAELEALLTLGYVAVILAGARLCEALARVHFTRARRYAERGFEYDADGDYYRCPEGERLTLHLVEPEGRLAVYRAPPSRCNGCPLKASCTPHDHGRHVYRPLAEWAETDIGQFHRRLSLLMFAVGALLSLVGLARWVGEAGSGWLLVALAASLACVVREARGGAGLSRPVDRRGQP